MKLTLIEWLLVGSIAGLVLLVVLANVLAKPGDTAKACAETCGPSMRPALLPNEYGVLRCACLPPGVQYAPGIER